MHQMQETCGDLRCGDKGRSQRTSEAKVKVASGLRRRSDRTQVRVPASDATRTLRLPLIYVMTFAREDLYSDDFTVASVSPPENRLLVNPKVKPMAIHSHDRQILIAVQEANQDVVQVCVHAAPK